MDKFDQWYNKKMDEQKVAYSESSWDSFSQQLNQLPGSRKRRRPFMYIWILSLIVIAGAGSIFAWQAFSKPSAEQEVLISTEEETTPARPSSSDNTDELNEEKASSQPLAATASPDSPKLKNESETTSSDLVSEKKVKKNTSNTSISQSNERTNTERSLTGIKDGSERQNKSAIQNTSIAQSNSANTSSENKEALTGEKTSDLTSSHAENKSNIELPADSDIALNNETVTGSQANEYRLTALDAISNTQVIEPLAVEIKSLEQNLPSLSESVLIMNDFNSLDPAISPTIVECCAYKGWTHHVELGAQFFPGVDQGSRFFTGLQAAYHLQYRWAQRWSASAGAGVIQRWGSFGGFQDSPQDIYTNTRVRRGFLLVPTSATYLQIPLMFNFHAGKHIISGGIRTHILMGVKGQLDEYLVQRNDQQESLSFASNTVNKGWINDNGFRSIVPEYMLSYSYQLNAHWGVSVSAAWMPNGIVFAEKTSKNQDILQSITSLDAGSSQQPYLLEDKWQAGVSLRYKF